MVTPVVRAEAQQGNKGPTIVLMMANAPEADIKAPNPRNPMVRAFLASMRALGWVDGQNITIERRSTEGKHERLAGLARELGGMRVDLIVLSAGKDPLLAVKQAIGSIPLVWLGVEPDWIVEVGLAKSLARPGGTVTGLSTAFAIPAIQAKRLQLLKEAIPRVSRVAYLTTPFPVPAEVEVAARLLSLTLLPVEIAAPDGLDRAFATMRQKRADAVTLGEGWFFQGHAGRLAELAVRERLAAMYRDRVFAEWGALMSYGVDWADMFRRASAYADKILKGANPGDIPIEQPTKFELMINLKTAKTLGLTIAPSMLARADEVIQ
jgi:putative ABC transport system substrate-binding protein